MSLCMSESVITATGKSISMAKVNGDPSASVLWPPRPDEAAERSEIEKLLEGIDQGKANWLMNGFARGVAHCNATTGEVMWTLAMLQAACLAEIPMGEQQVWAANRMREMLEIALPGAVMRNEQAHAQAEGRKPQ